MYVEIEHMKTRSATLQQEAQRLTRRLRSHDCADGDETLALHRQADEVLDALQRLAQDAISFAEILNLEIEELETARTAGQN